MSDLKPARWAEMVKLSRLRAPGATAVLSESRRLALEELIAEIERLDPGLLKWSVPPRSNEKSPTATPAAPTESVAIHIPPPNAVDISA